MTRKIIFQKLGYQVIVLALGRHEYMMHVYKGEIIVLMRTFDQDVTLIEFPVSGYFIVHLEDLSTVVYDLSATPSQQEVLWVRGRSAVQLIFNEVGVGLNTFSVTGVAPAVNKKPWYKQIPKKKLKAS